MDNPLLVKSTDIETYIKNSEHTTDDKHLLLWMAVKYNLISKEKYLELCDLITKQEMEKKNETM